MHLAYLDRHHDQLNNHKFLHNQMQQQMLMDIHHSMHELKYDIFLEIKTKFYYTFWSSIF
jgi:hypothetical protein